MPVELLTPDQARRYGRYTEDPSADQLSRYFHLDDTDRQWVDLRRGDHNRLGFALQLGTVRFLGTFLETPTDVPAVVLTYLAQQLDIADPNCVRHYAERAPTQREHAGEIQRRYGYRDFHGQPHHFQLVRWLYTRAWLSAERPIVLFDLATAWCVDRKILLPGVTVLERLIAQIRDRAAERIWRTLSRIPNADQRTRLLALLEVPARAHQSPFDRLRVAPSQPNSAGLVEALHRLEEVRALGIGHLPLAGIPPARLKTLARYALTSRAGAFDDLRDDRKLATLLAFAYTLTTTAQDDALDVLDIVIHTLLGKAERKGEKERVRRLPEYDEAALQLRAACEVLCDLDCKAAEVRETAFARISRERLLTAMKLVGDLARHPDDHYYENLLTHYSTVRRFLPALLAAITFAGNPAGQPVVEALDFLARREQPPPRPRIRTAPPAVVSRSWRRFVYGARGSVDERYYTFCTLDRLQDGMRRRDVFVEGSERWGDPRARLLTGPAWEAVRADVCRTLNHERTPAAEIAALTQQLDDAYRQTAARWDQNDAVRIEQQDGQDRLVLTPLDKLDEPASLKNLRKQVRARLPEVELPEVLQEVAAWTGMTEEFTHVSEDQARVADPDLSICAILLAEACNIGLEPLARTDHPALTQGRLGWIRQNYLRAETLTRANARLVDYHAGLPLVTAWGGGEVASADGLRFVVPVRTINAAPSEKYFGRGRGVTYYNFISNQFSGLHGLVVPGALKDSPYILEGLLEQQTRLQPREVMTDTGAYSDIVFGLFWLLGYQFSPRLADLGDTRFWRIDAAADYGVLNGLARNRIHTDVIARNWDDLLRVAGSLKLGTVRASDLIRTLQLGSRPSSIARAIGEVGRIAKTIYLLAYLDDESYRRRILTQLNRGEGRHDLARVVFHGQRGELRQKYREGQEDQLGALGLVLNMLVIWNTRYMALALDAIRASGQEVRDEDVARLSPLIRGHINMLGRYHFTLPDELRQGALRPLRNPDASANLLR